MRPDTPSAPARLVLVTGSGRSGTSSVTGILKLLGLHVPQPEAGATKSNPKGHFEPRWVLDLHRRLLSSVQVKLSDARPSAFEETAGAGLAPSAQRKLQTWLAEQMAIAPEVVVKDPRSSWFIPMWRQAASELDVPLRFLTMLRHPAEVTGSKHAYYYRRVSARDRRILETSRVAGWVNVSLYTELATRDCPRAFVQYTELIADWRSTLSDAATTLDLSLREGFEPERAARVDEFVDPSLHRIKATWDTLDVPQPLQDLAEEVWSQLSRLGAAGGSDPHAQAALDALRDTYQRMYDDAYAVAHSSTLASARKAVREYRARNARVPLRRRVRRGTARRVRRVRRRLRIAPRPTKA